MGVSFGSIVSNERTVAIDINGSDLHVTYQPNKLSPAFMDKITSDIDDDDSLGFAKLFCQVVSSWDLEGELGEGECFVPHGEPVPVAAEYVAWVPGSVLKYIIEQIGEDSAPKSKKGRRR